MTTTSPSAEGGTAVLRSARIASDAVLMMDILDMSVAEASTYSVNETASALAARLITGGLAGSRTGRVVSSTTSMAAGFRPVNGLPGMSSNAAGLASIFVAPDTTASAACRSVRLTTTVSVYFGPPGGGGGCATAAPPSTVLRTPASSRSTIPHGLTFPMNSSKRTVSVPSFRSSLGVVAFVGRVVSAVTLSGSADRAALRLPAASANAPGGAAMRAAPTESARSVRFRANSTVAE